MADIASKAGLSSGNLRATSALEPVHRVCRSLVPARVTCHELSQEMLERHRMLRDVHDRAREVARARRLREGEHVPEHRGVFDKRSPVDAKLDILSDDDEVPVVEPKLVVLLRRP